jgi:hypothetical protein
VPTLRGATPRETSAQQPLCADIDGCSLHTAVRVEAHDRKRLEQLCRYITRPALSDELTVPSATPVIWSQGCPATTKVVPERWLVTREAPASRMSASRGHAENGAARRLALETASGRSARFLRAADCWRPGACLHEPAATPRRSLPRSTEMGPELAEARRESGAALTKPRIRPHRYASRYPKSAFDPGTSRRPYKRAHPMFGLATDPP